GMKPVYRFFPWNRAFKLVETGQFLVSVGWIKNDERSKLVNFSKSPIYETETALFFLKKRPIKFDKFEDLIGLRIGLTRDYAWPVEFENAINKLNLQIEIAPSDELNMRKLLSGRIDVFPADRTVGRKLIEQMFDPIERGFIVEHPKSVGKGALWLITTKGNAKADEILGQFDKNWP